MISDSNQAEQARNQSFNVRIVQEYLEKVGSGNFNQAQNLFDDDVFLHIPGRNLLSGDYAGAAAVVKTFARMMELTDGTYRIVEFVDWLASDQRSVLIARQEATRNGKTLTWTRNLVFEISDGKINKIIVYEADQHSFDEFWS